MAIVQALLIALFRFLGKIVNTAISWATIMLFGKVDQSRQVYISLAALGSVLWLVIILGLAFPAIGLWLLSFARLPAGVDAAWVRAGMLAGVIVLPLLIGATLLVLFDRGRRARRGGVLLTILRGYPYTLGLSTTVLVMSVFAPLARLRHLARRWATMHVPIIIEDAYYKEVVADIQRALTAGAVETRVHLAPAVLRTSLKILTVLGGKGGGSVAADHLAVLRSRSAEILIHPSDLVIGAPEAHAARIRAILATKLTYTRAYRTYSKDANEIEDEIRSLWERMRREAPTQPERGVLDRLEARLSALPLDFEEWEILHRQILLVDREIRRLRAPSFGPRSPVRAGGGERPQ